MKVFTILIGILMAVCGIFCITTPITTTFSLMYFYLVLLLVTGIMLLAECIVMRDFGLMFIFSILTIIAGIFVFFSPNATFVTEMILLYIMAGWLIVRGVVGIVAAAQAKALTGEGVFGIAIVVSVLTLLLGIYSFIHPLVFSGVLGILAGVFFVMEGVDLIITAFVVSDIQE